MAAAAGALFDFEVCDLVTGETFLVILEPLDIGE